MPASPASASSRRSKRLRQPLRLIEIRSSKSTQSYDKNTKADLCASAAINDHWDLDLEKRELTVFRDPRQNADSPFGWRYTQTFVLDDSRTVSPLAKPEAELRVAEMLPPANAD